MIRMKTKISDIERICKRVSEIYTECIIDEFIEWAKADDEYLRNNKGFNDQTGNLRSSLGAGVYNDGQMVFSTAFSKVLNGAKGSSMGKAFVESIAPSTSGKIVKIIVAAMPYAQSVEDIDSKDVLESRRIQNERVARRILERAARKAQQQINRL